MIVLVAGASGHLGRELLSELRRRGHTARALVRDPSKLPAGEADEVVVADAEHDDLGPACRGADAVISVLGAPSRFDRGPRRPFSETDTKPNLRLLRAAEEAGVGRFAYLSVLGAPEYRDNPYADAHEAVADALRTSPVAGTVIRANAFFSAYDEMLDLALKGRFRLIGDPAARSNPIDDADLAVACLDALERGDEELEVGGPETMTRLEEAELAYAAAGRPGKKVPRIPDPVARGVARLLRPFDPRRAAVLDFLVTVCTRDMIGTPHGTRTLAGYLADRAASPRPREYAT